jgi:hypothetical protein
VYDATVMLDGRALLARSWWVDENATDDRSAPGRERS